MLFSPRLWLSSRSYPLIPVSEKLPGVSAPFDYILFLSLLVLLILIAVVKRPFVFVVLFLILSLFLVLTDQSRLQPWFYQYAFMLAAFAFYSGSRSEENQHALLNTCRLIIVSMYVWSGIQKLNVGFTDRIFTALINPYLNFVFGRVNLVPRPLILLIPLLEVGIGICLLVRKSRNIGVLMAVSMHLLILLLLIPLKVNSVVWQWNLAMGSFVFILFWKSEESSAREILLPRKLGYQALVLLLFGIMPLFNFLNLWDSYMSAALYSGNLPVAVIHVSEPARNRMPPNIQQHVQPSRTDDGFLINPTQWSLAELNVPDYRERRIFMGLTRKLCGYAETAGELKLTIYEKPNRWNGTRNTRQYTCADLQR